MDPAGWNLDIGDAFEEDEPSSFSRSGRSLQLFLVDCNDLMHRNAKIKDQFVCPLKLSLQVVRNMYSTKCMANSADYLSILLFNTNKVENEHEFSSICLLHPLSLPNVEKVKYLDHLLTEADGVMKIMKEHYGSGRAAIDEVFWLCSMILSACKVQRLSATVYLFTADDVPFGSDTALKKRAVQRMRDLKQKNVDIEVVPFGQNFDWEKFYVISFEDEQLPDVLPEPADVSAELLSRIVRKERRRHTYTSVVFSIGCEVDIAVSLYCNVSVTHLPGVVKLDGKTNDPVTTITSYVNEFTGEEVSRQEVVAYQTYGGRRIAMSFEELAQIKRICAPSIQLLGFASKDRLKTYHFVRSALFMQPNEKAIKGSSTLFNALMLACRKKSKIAICRFAGRRDTTPSLVALVPQLPDDGPMSLGCYLVFLPYQEDVRSVTVDDDGLAGSRPCATLLDRMRAFVANATAPLPFQKIHNPALQKHYKAVEAFALDLEDVEVVPDETLADCETIDRHLEPVLSIVRQPGSPSPVDLKLALEQGTLGRLTVAQLKVACHAQGVQLERTMRKAELIDAVRRHYFNASTD